MIKAKGKPGPKPGPKKPKPVRARDPKTTMDVDSRIKRKADYANKKLPDVLKPYLFKPGVALNPTGKVKMSDLTLQTKAMMREVLVDSIKQTFFKADVDLEALQKDTGNPPIIRGLAKRALHFIDTGDINILEYISKMAGMHNMDDKVENNGLKDFLIETILSHQALKKSVKDNEDNIVDV